MRLEGLKRKKIQCVHRISKPQPSGFWHSASTNYATTYVPHSMIVRIRSIRKGEATAKRVNNQGSIPPRQTAKLTVHLRLVPRLQMSGAIRPSLHTL
jgi:hypothetical protein